MLIVIYVKVFVKIQFIIPISYFTKYILYLIR